MLCVFVPGSLEATRGAFCSLFRVTIFFSWKIQNQVRRKNVLRGARATFHHTIATVGKRDKSKGGMMHAVTYSLNKVHDRSVLRLLPLSIRSIDRS